jgi:hypothetical protein
MKILRSNKCVQLMPSSRRFNTENFGAKLLLEDNITGVDASAEARAPGARLDQTSGVAAARSGVLNTS